MVERKLTNVPLEQPEKKYSHDEYLNLPDVKAADDAESQEEDVKRLFAYIGGGN